MFSNSWLEVTISQRVMDFYRFQPAVVFQQKSENSMDTTYQRHNVRMSEGLNILMNLDICSADIYYDRWQSGSYLLWLTTCGCHPDGGAR
jgi:hypothetical protein